MGATPADPATESALCVTCGLCCDGTLFSRTPLRTQHDRELAAANDVTIVQADGGDNAVQPCQFLRDCVCMRYAERYAVCHDFRCRQLRQIAAGHVTVAAAREHITEAQRLRDRLVDAQAEDNADRQTPAILLHRLALSRYLDAHFRPRPRTSDAASPSPAAGSPSA